MTVKVQGNCEMVEFWRREQMQRLKALFADRTMHGLISKNYVTFPFYIPRIYRMVSNWP